MRNIMKDFFKKEKEENLYKCERCGQYTKESNLIYHMYCMNCGSPYIHEVNQYEKDN